MKYYVILYEWKRYNRSGTSWVKSNKVTGKHPLDFLHELKRDYSEDDRGNKYDYILLWYAEISRELYEKYKDMMN